MILPQMNELSDLKCDIEKLFICISIRIDGEESGDDMPTHSKTSQLDPVQ